MTDFNPQQIGRIEQLSVDTKDAVVRVETKMDQGFEKINGRLRRLEYWRAYLAGAIFILGLLVTYLIRT